MKPWYLGVMYSATVRALPRASSRSLCISPFFARLMSPPASPEMSTASRLSAAADTGHQRRGSSMPARVQRSMAPSEHEDLTAMQTTRQCLLCVTPAQLTCLLTALASLHALAVPWPVSW